MKSIITFLLMEKNLIVMLMSENLYLKVLDIIYWKI